ncbi:hypothetical protein EMCRGX_G009824 [Ephydatia muelleri]
MKAMKTAISPFKLSPTMCLLPARETPDVLSHLDKERNSQASFYSQYLSRVNCNVCDACLLQKRLPLFITQSEHLLLH